jgi:hypothetical protein
MMIFPPRFTVLLTIFSSFASRLPVSSWSRSPYVDAQWFRVAQDGHVLAAEVAREAERRRLVASADRHVDRRRPDDVARVHEARLDALDRLERAPVGHTLHQVERPLRVLRRVERLLARLAALEPAVDALGVRLLDVRRVEQHHRQE